MSGASRPAAILMVQGTASCVGKSVLVSALCRLFRDDGVRVAPFKAVNMSNNAAVTADGLEIGRAQAVQAAAARIEPHVDMNPVLLKPEGSARSQVVLMGRAVGRLEAADDAPMRPALESAIAAALARLRSEHELVIIEGAGSPAEINLRDRDLANMHVARLARAPVILVGDIDRGGVFASLLGTVELLPPEERALVRGMVVNKMRGDALVLQSGLAELERRTAVPVLGVFPFLEGLGLPEEDAAVLDAPATARAAGAIDVAVVRAPCISNFDDVLSLGREPEVELRYVERATDLAGADLVVLPGSKGTVLDLLWMRARGIDGALLAAARAGTPLLGICGGCQMLGLSIEDPDHVESAHGSLPGLGLLDLVTVFDRVKVTAQARARVETPTFLGADAGGSAPVTGYEIHMGALRHTSGARPAFRIVSRNEQAADVLDGAVSSDGLVVGTMLHGILENAEVRASLLAWLRARKGLPAAPPVAATQDPFDRLSEAARRHLDVAALRRLCLPGNSL